ncbi:MAG: helix-turn-helix transcriptional regulator [Chloroflexi bacterium]|nr:helix-turn-helix transcriptional regulator [Chloroflexota bacterium]
MSAGTCLRLHRHKKNWGLEELAKASSVNKSTINRLENNQSDRISLTAAVNLDRALDAGGQVFSMFWAAAQLQMGVVVATDEIKSARYYWSEKTQHLIDTFLKLARWSHLYDDPELPWLTATPGKEEILEFIETFKTKQKVGDVDVPTFVRKIEMLIPGNFSLMGEEEAKTSPEPDIQRGLTVWMKIKNHVGDDPFGIRILKLYSQNFLEFDYISAFRVLLRELLMNDHSFFNEMKEMVDEENEKNMTKRKDD